MSSPTIQPLLSAGRYILVASLATKFIKLTKIMFSTRAPFCLLFTPFALFPPFLRVSFVKWSCPFQPVFLFIPLSVFLLCHASCSRVRCLLCASCSKVCSVFLLGTFYTSSFLQCCTRLRLVLCCLLRQFFFILGLNIWDLLHFRLQHAFCSVTLLPVCLTNCQERKCLYTFSSLNIKILF